MRQAMMPNGELISIDQFRALDPADRPSPLKCPGSDLDQNPCEGKTRAHALTSKVAPAKFAASHISGCRQDRRSLKSSPGDAGHDHPVRVEGVRRIDLTPALSRPMRFRRIPDDDTPGTLTQRLYPAGDGENAERRDTTNHLITFLSELITGTSAGLIECPITHDRYPVEDYFLRLETARGTTGWRAFYGQIDSTFTIKATGSLELKVRLNGALASRRLRLLISKSDTKKFLRGAKYSTLPGRWVIALAEASPHRDWISPTAPSRAVMLKDPVHS